MQQETGRTATFVDDDGNEVELKEFSAPAPGGTVWLEDENGATYAVMAVGETTWWSSEPVTVEGEAIVPDGLEVIPQPANFF
jgi:hypothetical protein